VLFLDPCSASEISRAQHKLQSESAALKNATRLAELATSATENFKAMMEEQRRIAQEMRAMSKPRLRWIKAIRRVMTLNYIANAKKRLLNSSFAEWFMILMAKAAAEEAAEAEARAAEEKAAAAERESLARQRSILAANASSKSSRSNAADRSKNKVARRSLDNSQLPSLSTAQLPSLSTMDIASPTAAGESAKLGAGAGANSSSLPQLGNLGSPSSKNLPEKLLLDPMERRRQAKAERDEARAAAGGPASAKLSKIGKSLSRRSFGGETEAELTKYQAGLAPAPAAEVVEIPTPTAGSRPPSLLESYSTKGAAFLQIPLIDTSESGKGLKLLESKSVPRRARA
jgi:hypothetical protein